MPGISFELASEHRDGPGDVTSAAENSERNYSVHVGKVNMFPIYDDAQTQGQGKYSIKWYLNTS